MNFWKCPALPFVELREAKESHACFQPHSHDEFSFGMLKGRALYQNMGESQTIGDGTLVTINPGDAHSCNPIGDHWSYRMLFIDAQWIGEWQDSRFDMHGLDYLPFRESASQLPGISRDFQHLFDGLAYETDAFAAECLLLEKLDTVFGSLMKDQPEEPRWRSAAAKLSLAAELLQDRLEENVSLDDLAIATGLSRYHLVRAFKKHYGLTPHGYQLDLRIKQAKKMLVRGARLAETAHGLGFADQAHFQRSFKQRLAVTPRQYQGFFR
ncbi:helix-turn-helix transcriptional regulator [Aestuariispira insulae]|nr:AraC family transcriptional regulator [Aestuariispira insulae]